MKEKMQPSKKKMPKSFAGKVWYFIWEDDSIFSWIVNIVLAFLIIKFIVYPGLGFLLGTTHPIVAVVSGSMEHKMVQDTASTGKIQLYEICGRKFTSKERIDFNRYWQICGTWYEDNKNITSEIFLEFPYRNGFNTGDLMILMGTSYENIMVGDIIVFQGNRPDPIIHRVVAIIQENEYDYVQTKGDHNANSWQFESEITADKYIGKAILRIPLLGWVKIGFVKLITVIAEIFA